MGGLRKICILLTALEPKVWHARNLHKALQMCTTKCVQRDRARGEVGRGDIPHSVCIGAHSVGLGMRLWLFVLR